MLALADISLPTQVLLAVGLALIAVWMYVHLQKQKKARALNDLEGGEPRRGGKLTPEEKLERMKQTRGMEGDLASLMVEIERLTQRFGDQLDTRTAQLERLLRDADEKIARLERAQGVPPSSSAAVERPAPKAPPPDDPLARAVYDLADKGLPPGDIARRLNEHVGKVDLILALRDAG